MLILGSINRENGHLLELRRLESELMGYTKDEGTLRGLASRVPVIQQFLEKMEEAIKSFSKLPLWLRPDQGEQKEIDQKMEKCRSILGAYFVLEAFGGF
ncbi:MAG: hypothetical protein FJZ64_00580 [Chlamydiae bacterium]|nr:hypothetical protein [Chlamydiota bacterium]